MLWTVLCSQHFLRLWLLSIATLYSFSLWSQLNFVAYLPENDVRWTIMPLVYKRDMYKPYYVNYIKTNRIHDDFIELHVDGKTNINRIIRIINTNITPHPLTKLQRLLIRQNRPHFPSHRKRFHHKNRSTFLRRSPWQRLRAKPVKEIDDIHELLALYNEWNVNGSINLSEFVANLPEKHVRWTRGTSKGLDGIQVPVYVHVK